MRTAAIDGALTVDLVNLTQGIVCSSPRLVHKLQSSGPRVNRQNLPSGSEAGWGVIQISQVRWDGGGVVQIPIINPRSVAIECGRLAAGKNSPPD